ncbi:MAG: hypothetical protein CVU91_11785 [Firmicutes bacterium HGW-Firmicutes-16]|nr:MAG: hypothetical protein CVU91_11785 [Firmicutes bacterium HGW-Firmicutes-16]
MENRTLGGTLKEPAALRQIKQERMCEMQTLSAAGIRYLIVLNDLDGECGIRSIDIAEKLALTKPSVHRMIEALSGRALVNKVKYGTVFLTDEGRRIAIRYASYFDVVFFFLSQKLSLTPEDAKNAAVALLAEIPDERIGDMCEKMQDLT